MWWNSMSTFQQTMFIIACAATFLLVMQILLMLISGSNDADAVGGGLTDGGFDGDVSDGGDFTGGGSDGDFSGDLPSVFDGGGSSTGGAGSDDASPDAVGSGGGALAAFGLRLISLRSIIAFLAIGGWVGYTLCYSLDWYYSLIIALVCGFAAACGMAGAMLGMEKMQSSGNLDPHNAVGKIGTVYLTIPPDRAGQGKVNILIQERYAEYEAVTDDNSPLPTASEIKVVKHLGSNVLLVTKYKKPSITIETVK